MRGRPCVEHISISTTPSTTKRQQQRLQMELDESSASSSSLPQQQQQQRSSSSLLHDVLGSATAGIISRLVTHPLDTVKARLQAPPPPSSSGSYASYRGPIDALVSTYRNEGIRSLYGGFGAVIVGGENGTKLYINKLSQTCFHIIFATLNLYIITLIYDG